MIDWQDLHHSDLSVSQLYALLQLRCAVFVVEQNCPYRISMVTIWREKIATFSVGITGHWWRMRGF